MLHFCARPDAFVHARPNSRSEKIQHVIWGDEIEVGEDPDPPVAGWKPVQGRGRDGWMREEDLQEQRLLEITFVDVDQGDGCFIVTPGGRRILVDAGQYDNMYRFLRWRYRRLGSRAVFFQHAIITHPDKDHYAGFGKILDRESWTIGTLHHNGIVERSGGPGLGPREGRRPSYLTDVIRDRAQLRRITNDPAKRGSRLYPKLMHKADTNGRVDDIRMLCSFDEYLPGYGEQAEVSIAVLGPVPEPDDQQRLRLRRFSGGDGIVKNGHSIVLKLRYGNLSAMLGGDLNVPSEDFLLEHYTGLDPHPRSLAEHEELVAAARRTFECIVAKACHHGSHDFRDAFLEAENPVATVISSGDRESYGHPRPDALGSFGRYGRGRRPLIFSTELARSNKAPIGYPDEIREQIAEVVKQLENAGEDSERKLLAKLREEKKRLEKVIAIYGTITLRSDGECTRIFQKLEQRDSKGRKWMYFELAPGPDGVLRFTPQH